jgi:hypothetical protein
MLFFKVLNFDWYARVHRERTIRKGLLVESTWIQWGKPFNSFKGSIILEGTGSADRRIGKPTVTVKMTSS